MKIRIENIVGVIEFDRLVDLNQVLGKLKHLGIQRLKRLPGLKLRINNVAILIYKSKAIIAGVKSVNELKAKARKLIEVLNNEGIEVSIRNTRIENITATISLNRRMNLKKIAELLKGAYDPDYRPCAVVKIYGVTVMIYENGNVLVIGAKTFEQIKEVTSLLEHL
ncbi:MAG: hypothetical protein DRI01_09135 [Chloroflexi bacterium]|nr:MAG: hypothetical protein DRI01_09135 [Chloroflexota bacterium]